MYEIAGAIGIDPSPLTLRELLAMHVGRGRDQWGQAAMITATIANANRDPKKRRRPFEAAEFNPFAEKKKSQHGRFPINKSTIEMLKVFV